MAGPRYAALYLSLTAILGACAEPSEELPPPPSEELAATAGSDWLVRRVRFEEAYPVGDQRVVAGLDIDGRDSGEGSEDRAAPCTEWARDYAWDLDRSRGGVDNAAQGLIVAAESISDLVFQDALDRAVEEGRIRWGLRLGALDENTLAIALLAIDPAEAITVDAMGRPVAGQRLRAEVVATVSAHAEGHLAWGLTEAEGLRVVGDEVELLPFDELRVSGLAVHAPGADGVLTAQLAGSFTTDSVLDSIERSLPPELFDASVRRAFQMILEDVADLEPTLNARICGRISAGFTFEAVPAELVN